MNHNKLTLIIFFIAYPIYLDISIEEDVNLIAAIVTETKRFMPARDPAFVRIILEKHQYQNYSLFLLMKKEIVRKIQLTSFP